MTNNIVLTKDEEQYHYPLTERTTLCGQAITASGDLYHAAQNTHLYCEVCQDTYADDERLQTPYVLFDVDGCMLDYFGGPMPGIKRLVESYKLLGYEIRVWSAGTPQRVSNEAIFGTGPDVSYFHKPQYRPTADEVIAIMGHAPALQMDDDPGEYPVDADWPFQLTEAPAAVGSPLGTRGVWFKGVDGKPVATRPARPPVTIGNGNGKAPADPKAPTKAPAHASSQDVAWLDAYGDLDQWQDELEATGDPTAKLVSRLTDILTPEELERFIEKHADEVLPFELEDGTVVTAYRHADDFDQDDGWQTLTDADFDQDGRQLFPEAS